MNYTGKKSELYTPASTASEYKFQGNQPKIQNAYNYKKQVSVGIHGLPFDQQNDENYWQSKQILPNINRPLGSGIKNALLINEGVYNINPIAGTNNFSGLNISVASGLNPTNYSIANTDDIEDRIRANAVAANDPLSAQYAKGLVAPGAQIDPNNVEGDAMLNSYRSESSVMRNAKAQVYDSNLKVAGQDFPYDNDGEGIIYGQLRANLYQLKKSFQGRTFMDTATSFLNRHSNRANPRQQEDDEQQEGNISGSGGYGGGGGGGPKPPGGPSGKENNTPFDQLDTNRYVPNAGTTLTGKTFTTSSGQNINTASNRARNVTVVGQNDMPESATKNETSSPTATLGQALAHLALPNPYAINREVFTVIGEPRTESSMITDPELVRQFSLGTGMPAGTNTNPYSKPPNVPPEYEEPKRERSYSVEMEDSGNEFTRRCYETLNEDAAAGNEYSFQAANLFLREGEFVPNSEAKQIFASFMGLDPDLKSKEAVQAKKELEESFTNLQQVFARLDKDHEKLSQAMGRSKAETGKIQSELISAKSYNNDLQQKHDNAIDQVNNQKKEITQLESIVERSKTEIASLQSQIQSSHLTGDKKNDALSNRIHQLEAVVRQAETAIDGQQASFSNERQAYQSEIYSLRADKDYNKMQIQTLIDRAGRLGVEVSDLKQEAYGLNAQVSDLSGELSYTRGELQRAEEELKKEREENGRKTTIAKGLEAQIKAYRKTIKDLDQEVQSERAMKENLQSYSKGLQENDARLVRELRDLNSKYSAVYEQLQVANTRGGEMSGYAQNLETQLTVLRGQITSLSDVKTHAAYQELLQKGGALQNELSAANVKLTSQSTTIGDLEAQYTREYKRANELDEGGKMIIKRLEGDLQVARSERMGFKEMGSNKRSAVDQGISMIANPYQPNFAANSDHIQSSTNQLQTQFNVAEMIDQQEALAIKIQQTQNVLGSIGGASIRGQLNLKGMDAGNASAALSSAFMDSLDSDDPTKVRDIFGRQYQNAIRAGMTATDIKKAINNVLAHKFGRGGGGAAPLLEVHTVTPFGMKFKRGKVVSSLNYL